MSEIIFKIFGVLLFIALAIVHFYGVFRAFRRGKYFFSALVALCSCFFVLFNMAQSPVCDCITSSFIFRNLTIWFMGMFERILESFSMFIPLTILILAGMYVLLGERTIAPRIFVEFAINMILASLWAVLLSAVVTFYICPLICEHSLDLNEANQKIWSALRKWLGTEGTIQ